MTSAVTNGLVLPSPGRMYSGYVVIGSGLYSSYYIVKENGRFDPEQHHNFRVGGGWGDATFLESSYPNIRIRGPWSTTTRCAATARSPGGTSKGGFGWTNPQSAGGFAAVKTMALISQTPTYDTFLANTRAARSTRSGPPCSPMKPIVKKVRTSTWQGFEALVAEVRR